ncbi:hypothetical protein K2Z83_28390 [Oscillochloris sp. ZM17-4]|uniref:hypothetical protein n=1 Tax=Oscillochloris sp. ZM17-4 TaxID=2866714 RepID=UPI001C730C3B|nr:hypothetical protein [Oscillochloris sp. ZM17-4]MBX0331575.1 hypothetical protein [Oscillochloris sp. ZM17-4]
MLWCLIPSTIISLILALLSLIASPPRLPRPRRMSPRRLLRGCLAGTFLLLSLLLGLITLVLARPDLLGST